MKVVGFAGYSGAGKTTLVERLIPVLKLLGQRVSVVKHAHHKFDIDHPGKDTYRHREAGAFEVVVASDKRLAADARIRSSRSNSACTSCWPSCDPAADWVLVEGFKHSDVLKIEVWREPAAGEPSRPVLLHRRSLRHRRGHRRAGQPAVAHRTAAVRPQRRRWPLAKWLLDMRDRFDYNPDHHG